jgi:hypothetical protein
VTIVLGGTAALRAYLVWGAVLFLIKKSGVSMTFFMICCLIMSIKIVKSSRFYFIGCREQLIYNNASALGRLRE